MRSARLKGSPRIPPLGKRIPALFATLIADPAGDRMIDARTDEIA
jgi:hypothetical protein